MPQRRRCQEWEKRKETPEAGELHMKGSEVGKMNLGKEKIRTEMSV